MARELVKCASETARIGPHARGEEGGVGPREAPGALVRITLPTGFHAHTGKINLLYTRGKIRRFAK